MSDADPRQDEVPEGLALGDHPLTARRLEKVEQMRAAGIEPYPLGYGRTALAADIHQRHHELPPESRTAEIVEVAGRVMNLRRLGKLVFGVLQDVSGRMQLFVDNAGLGDESFAAFEELDSGDWIWAKGEIITTRRGELSVHVNDFAVLAKGLRPLPEKWHGLQDQERRYRQRELDLLVNEDTRRIAATRLAVVAEMRRQFETRGFVEVETPILQTQAGGALARPFKTYHNALGIEMYMRIATELHLKRLVVGGMERVFEIGRIFRNEGIDARHNPEFTTLEAYQALADYHDIMVLMEEIFSAVANKTVGHTEISYDGRSVDLAPPYRRQTMLELVSVALGDEVTPATSPERLRTLMEAVGIESDPAAGFGKLVQRTFDERVEETLWEPTFVMDHPIEISPLTRAHRTVEGLVERFELYIAGAEYVDAFTELNDPIDQRRRFEAQAVARAAGDEEAHPIDEEFLRALEVGMPPTGGLGIGIDRLVMLLTDQSNIREVVLFPHLRPEA